MKHYRYGEFRFSDYWLSWGGIIVLQFFSLTTFVLDLSPLLIVFPTIYTVVWLWTILAPHREYFYLHKDSISVFQYKQHKTIVLPSELTVIVSYVDICPPLSMRTAMGNQTHILKNKYAVSILQNVPLNTALDALHRNYVKKYTTSTIKAAFDDYHFVYSFVCNQDLLNQLICDRHCQLIVPESMLTHMSRDMFTKNLYIDNGY